jgi:hypothetical protein
MTPVNFVLCLQTCVEARFALHHLGPRRLYMLCVSIPQFIHDKAHMGKGISGTGVV